MTEQKTQEEWEKEAGYTATDQMVISAARQIHNDDVVYVGVGLPMLSSLMAKNSHAPDCNVVIENGTVRSYIFDLPRATDSLPVHYMADLLTGLGTVNYLGQAGHINIGFMGAGQIDRYGNVNDTAIGDYYNPVHRWPGSGGGNDVMSFCKATTVILRQSKQRFPEHVDFVTCPGYINGKPGEREAIGLPDNTGPFRVITNLGIYGFENGEMVLISVHGGVGVTVDKVKAEVGWDLKVSPDIHDTEPPTADELKVFREKVDPGGIWQGGRRNMGGPAPQKGK